MRATEIAVFVGAVTLLLVSCAPTAEPEPPTAVPTPTEELTPSVLVSDQDASAGTVTIDHVVAAEPGWLVIHITQDGGPGPVIGQALVAAGVNEAVEVEIDLARATGQLFAMLHLDTGTTGEYEFPAADPPVSVGDQIINVPFNATFPITPSVNVSDQDASAGIVTIDSVVAAQPGWLVIHVTKDGAPSAVIGQAPVIVGYNPELTVEIDLSKASGQLFAMLHLDAGAAGVYEFPGEDAPVFVADQIVNVPFNVTFPVEAGVEASDQAAVEGTVTIARVTAVEPGWIVIHTDVDGAPGPVIGYAPVVVGNNLNVTVEIDLEQATTTLYAMLHVDAGIAGEYNFPGDDLPVAAAEGTVPFQLREAGASAGEVVVLVVDASFRDKEVTVPVGTTVMWVYNGGLPHTVTSDSGLFNSGALGDGATFTFTFDEPGRFPYHCRFHGGPGGAGMSGVIIVEGG